MQKIMQIIQKIRTRNPQLANDIIKRGGIILDNEVDELVKIDRFLPVSVRCKYGEFRTQIQDLKHFVSIINSQRKMVEAYTGQNVNANTDYVKDVSLVTL